MEHDAAGGTGQLTLVPRVFVYPPLDPPIPCTNSRVDKDLFESKVSNFLRSSRMRVLDPRNATIFYMPSCLTDYYFRVRNERNGTRMLRHAEARVLAQVDALGFAHVPHVLNCLRCWGQGRAGMRDEHSHIIRGFPQLWGSTRFARFCTEALHTVDTSRAVHVPYCSSTRHAHQSPLLEPLPDLGAAAPVTLPRKTKVLFIGSHLFSRRRVLQKLHRQNFSRQIVIINPFRRTAPGTLWCA